VLWARTWHGGGTNVYRVTSKKAWQRYAAKLKEQHIRSKEQDRSFREDMPTFFHEGNDKDALLKMLELAQPLSVETKER
jgi:hypothetical protein